MPLETHLQLDVIERALVLWSNRSDVVLTPFMGIGSEVYCAVRMDRRAIGIELKETYYRQAERNIATAKDQTESLFDFIANRPGAEITI